MSVTIPASDHSPSVRSRAVADHPVPSGREEEWRFTPLARLRGLHTGELDLSGALGIAVRSKATGGVSVHTTAICNRLLTAKNSTIGASSLVAYTSSNHTFSSLCKYSISKCNCCGLCGKTSNTSCK